MITHAHRRDASASSAHAGRWGDGMIVLAGVAVIMAARWLQVADAQVCLRDGTAVGGMCWSRALVGVPCPFCGVMRSVISFFHGDVAMSLAFHPGGALLALTLVGSVAAVAFMRATGQRPLSARPGYSRFIESIALVCLAAGVVRYLW